MKLYRLNDDLHVRNRWFLGDVTSGGTDCADALTRGCTAALTDLHADFTRAGCALAFSLTAFAVPVASKDFAQRIARFAGEDVQRLPLAIPGHRGFEILNITRRVACLDERQSEFIKWRVEDERPDKVGQYRQVSRLRIDVARLPEDIHVFRIAGWHAPIVVTEAVKAAAEAGGHLGAKFEPLF